MPEKIYIVKKANRAQLRNFFCEYLSDLRLDVEYYLEPYIDYPDSDIPDKWFIRKRNIAEKLGEIIYYDVPAGYLVKFSSQELEEISVFINEIIRKAKIFGFELEIQDFVLEDKKSYESFELKEDPCGLLPKGEKKKNKWKQIYRFILKKESELLEDYKDNRNQHRGWTIADLQDAYAEQFKETIGEKTLRKIKIAGKRGCLK